MSENGEHRDGPDGVRIKLGGLVLLYKGRMTDGANLPPPMPQTAGRSRTTVNDQLLERQIDKLLGCAAHGFCPYGPEHVMVRMVSLISWLIWNRELGQSSYLCALHRHDLTGDMNCNAGEEAEDRSSRCTNLGMNPDGRIPGQSAEYTLRGALGSYDSG